ncbi:MAG TPA: ABC transporter permease [Paenirhodobacter sp.]
MINTAPRSGLGWVWIGPATLLFLGVMIVPLLMTFLLTFYSWSSTAGIVVGFSWANWAEVLGDPYFFTVLWRTLHYSTLSTLIVLLVGVPEAIIIARMSKRWRGFCLLAIVGPLLVSVVARTLGWTLLFGGANGLVNQLLMHLGLIRYPLPFMFTSTGTIIALAHVLMPMMVLSVSASIQKINPQIENAARSLGAPYHVVMRRIVLPQILPGILSGTLIVFAMAASSFATPAIIGGRRLKVATTLIYDEFTNTLNWPLGAVIAVLLLVGLVAIFVGCNALMARRGGQGGAR